MRDALSNRGLGSRDVLQAITITHESPRKRRRMDGSSVTEAAWSGIHSRLVRLVLSGWTGDWSSIIAQIRPASMESSQDWAGDVLLAARLRLLNTLRWAQAAWPLEIDITRLIQDDTLLETRLELVGALQTL
jgi:hypothetical protein